jgi:hypothetical protein
MGRKPIPEDEKIKTITIGLPGWIIKRLKGISGYSKLIEKLLIDYFRKNSNS